MESLTEMPELSPAASSDLALITELLASSGLPSGGVAENIRHFYVARDRSGAVVGTAGAEIHGQQALLRSVCVAPDWRNRGLGTLLAEAVLARARSAGCREVYLLTTTAAGYFSRRGFARVDRSSVTGPVLRSVEFTSACPKSATVMRMTLSEDP